MPMNVRNETRGATERKKKEKRKRKKKKKERKISLTHEVSA